MAVGSGFGGKGYKFDEAEEKKREEHRKQQKMAYGIEVEFEEEEEGYGSDEEAPFIKEPALSTDVITSTGPIPLVGPAARNLIQEEVARPGLERGNMALVSLDKESAAKQELNKIMRMRNNANLTLSQQQANAMRVAAAIVKQAQKNNQNGDYCVEEIEINDFPQQVRWKVTHKDSLSAITEFTGVAITAKGTYVFPGRNPPPGERKLYLLLEGPDSGAVAKAKTEIKRLIQETLPLCAPEPRAAVGRYSVL